MNLLHPRWDRTRENLTIVFVIITFLAWLLGIMAEPPWWWAIFPTAALFVLLWWEAAAYPPPPPPPEKPRRNHIGQLVSSAPRPPPRSRLP